MQSIFNLSDFKERREKLIKKIKDKFPNNSGAIVLFGGFEIEGFKFRQESSFYYFTGIKEPGSVLVINSDGITTLFLPNTGTRRIHWIHSVLSPQINPEKLGFDQIKYLGDEIKGYEFYPFFSKDEYKNLLLEIEKQIKDGFTIFTLNPNNQYQYFQQRFILQRLSEFIPNVFKSIQDISGLASQLRRIKSKKEIEVLYKAVDITIMGHEAIWEMIKPGMYENEIQAAIEYIFTSANANIAFSSIVGSGINSTVLHYTLNNKQLNKDEVMVIDIGAQFDYYCGDLTRTYPVSGKFTKRQQEIYDTVLQTQEYIETIAKPGMYLSNKNNPENSLNHLANEFLKERGYEKYFIHGIGHFLGLDVHDVGDYLEPLQVGDVITIEPGIYISQEKVGVRIEDNYWIVEDGLVCLSEHLPKSSNEVEKLIKNS